MKGPLATIIIPCFNAAHWLPAAIDSILAQTYRPIEIIAVNDGSTDSTSAILTDYETLYPTLVRTLHQTNKGQSAAANYGLTYANGKFIKFFDADDWLAPDSIEAQVTALTDRPNHLAYGQWGRFYKTPEGAKFVPHPGWHHSDTPINWICETWADTEPMYQCGLWLIPKGLLDKVGGWDEKLSLINDFEFFTRLVLGASGIVHTPEARLHYRSGIPSSLSAQKSRSAWESAHRSTWLACQHLLARQNSRETRLAAAKICQNLVFALYPQHKDLAADLILKIESLGGATHQPNGGRIFRLVSGILGWRVALRIRSLWAHGSQP
jgi:glycosyltransferase involved in cell wall biosynthesis